MFQTNEHMQAMIFHSDFNKIKEYLWLNGSKQISLLSTDRVYATHTRVAFSPQDFPLRAYRMKIAQKNCPGGGTKTFRDRSRIVSPTAVRSTMRA